MTDVEKMLQEYEKKLNELYARANTKSKKKRILYDLFNFSSICYDHFGIEKEFDWEKNEEMLNLFEDLEMSFVENTLERKGFYSDLSKKVIDTFIEIDYPFYKDYGKFINGLTPVEMEELIFDFLNSYDSKLLEEYKRKVNNFEVFDTDELIYNYDGLTYPFEALRKSLIFCVNNNSIASAAILMHELGHSYEYNIAYKCGMSNYSTAIDKLPYTEVSSRFFEYAFYNYLKEQRILTNDVDMCLRSYYETMLEHLYGINIITKINFIKINSYGYVEIENKELSTYAKELQERLNYYSTAANIGEQINYKYAFIYGLGSLFSIYLYEKYKDDPNYFKKEFRNALINYKYNGIDAFKKVGVTPEILIKGDALKRVLRNSR